MKSFITSEPDGQTIDLKYQVLCVAKFANAFCCKFFVSFILVALVIYASCLSLLLAFLCVVFSCVFITFPSAVVID